ncbi:DNA-directed RNA polymerase subunit alpha [bacterium]|nr:DNA-directed RNA polymerase subunit alpha [bacterium]
MIEIAKPKIKYQSEPDQIHAGAVQHHGVLTIEPLERGYGQTLGNSFRRVLLSSLPGSAVSMVKIDGVLHEFCSIPGVVEDITEMILNLKKLVVGVEQEEIVTARLEATGPCQVTAANIQSTPNLLVYDKDIHIASVTGNIKLGMDITFKRGRGYYLAEKHRESGQPIDLILVDSQFSPVTKVMFSVDDARVGQDINYDKLTLQVWTKANMQPREAIELAAKFLKAHVELFMSLEEEAKGETVIAAPTRTDDLVMVASQKEETQKRAFHNIPIKDLEFSVRSRNCLKKAGIQFLGELVTKRAMELLEIKNFGKKSLKEIREKLRQYSMFLNGEENGGGVEE